ncbi:MAG: hypothetical protein H0U52_01055 [Chloroflexi bacterium]|nr:hypothetical protein [Chloroflexota bacterium]
MAQFEFEPLPLNENASDKTTLKTIHANGKAITITKIHTRHERPETDGV